jgi:hypothetical protein
MKHIEFLKKCQNHWTLMISLHTGEEVESTAEYNHMQLDCVSLYLLYLVQMISSGLEIIYRFFSILIYSFLIIHYTQQGIHCCFSRKTPFFY